MDQCPITIFWLILFFFCFFVFLQMHIILIRRPSVLLEYTFCDQDVFCRSVPEYEYIIWKWTNRQGKKIKASVLVLQCTPYCKLVLHFDTTLVSMKLLQLFNLLPLKTWAVFKIAC